MKYTVSLTRDARDDLDELYEFIAESDTVSKADYVLDEIQKAAKMLTQFPERGAYPSELQELGIYDFRQTFFKPYRIIYRIFEKQVIIYLIADGRRDMQTLLARRLLIASPLK